MIERRSAAWLETSLGGHDLPHSVLGDGFAVRSARSSGGRMTGTDPTVRGESGGHALRLRVLMADAEAESLANRGWTMNAVCDPCRPASGGHSRARSVLSRT